MSQAILTFLEGWWARWFHRAGGIRTEAEIYAPAPEVAEVENEKTANPFDLKEVEQSFLETVRIDPTKVAAKVPFVADPKVRDATLGALEHLKQIPALQSLVQGVNQIMGRDGVTVDEVVGALEKDSALCVRVLTMANSVSVASEQRIEDLQTAVQMLGISRVRRLAQAVFTLRGAQQMADGLDWRHLWIHALATAAVAEELDRRTSSETSPQIYLAGLLHDVGKIVLSTVDSEIYRDIVVASWNMEGRLEELEIARMGVGHREAGVIFAKANQLSAVVVEVIGHHDNPAQSKSHRYEVALVSIANFMCKARGLGFSGARLDAVDGEIEDLPAWKILTEKSGWTPDAAVMQKDMREFFATLRDDLRGIGSGA